MIDQRRGTLAVVARIAAIGCGLASAVLAVYGAMLVYAAATFEHDSLPGPVVLSMVAVAVWLAAILSGGLTHLLWRASKQPGDVPGHPR